LEWVVKFINTFNSSKGKDLKGKTNKEIENRFTENKSTLFVNLTNFHLGEINIVYSVIVAKWISFNITQMEKASSCSSSGI